MGKSVIVFSDVVYVIIVEVVVISWVCIIKAFIVVMLEEGIGNNEGEGMYIIFWVSICFV